MKNTQLKVAVLCGGYSSEDYLSRRSGALIFAHANRARYLCSLFNWNADGGVDESAPGESDRIIARHDSILAAFAVPGRFDIVVNTLHGELECDGQLQSMFELARQPYTGNGRMPSINGMNKIFSKKIMREAGFLTPDWFSFRDNHGEHGVEKSKAIAAFGFPLVVKAATGGSSNSVLLVNDEAQMDDAIQTLLSTFGDVYVEPFLTGLEYTVGVFGDPEEQALVTFPVARMHYEGHIFDAEIKKADRYQVVIPCGLSDSWQNELQDIARRLHECFRFTAFSRVDFRFLDGKPYLLEVNTHPGFGENSIVPMMLRAANISLETAVDWMIENGLSRKPR